MTYFKNIKSLEDLKAQYKVLLKKYRWEVKSGTTVNETADSTRRRFYTEYGWEGKNHNRNRSLKEIANIVRAYVKEKYATYKFSVRTSYASMCPKLHVELKESPIQIYKNKVDELTQDERSNSLSALSRNLIFTMVEVFITWILFY